MNNVDTKKFNDIIEMFDLVNLVKSPTFRSGHTLDLILAKPIENLFGNIDVDPVATISDHMLINTTLNVGSAEKQTKTILFRNKNSLNSAEFANTVRSLISTVNSSCEHSIDQKLCTMCLVSNYQKETSEYFERNAPLIEKTITISDSHKVWYNSDIKKANRALRKVEKL